VTLNFGQSLYVCDIQKVNIKQTKTNARYLMNLDEDQNMLLCVFSFRINIK